MARQLVLDLPFRAAMGTARISSSPAANAAAVAGIDGWRDWPGAKMLLVGPEGSGKTHLAHVYAAQAGARIIGADRSGGDRPGRPPAEEPALAGGGCRRIARDVRPRRRPSFTCTMPPRGGARRSLADGRGGRGRALGA